MSFDCTTCIRMKLGDLNLSELMLYEDEEYGEEYLNFVSADFNM